ncbi:hypothetical protein ACTXT7_015068 [Hymenolepis weldensis]
MANSDMGKNHQTLFPVNLLPAIILMPQFIAAGTKLFATGYPGENATLTCEALGGLHMNGGFNLTLLRGSGLKELAEQAITAKGTIAPPTFISNSAVESSDYLDERPEFSFSKSIEVISNKTNDRYRLTSGPDPRNPYAAMVRLTITVKNLDKWLSSEQIEIPNSMSSFPPPKGETLKLLQRRLYL